MDLLIAVQFYLILGGLIASSMALVGNAPTSLEWVWAFIVVIFLWPIVVLVMIRDKRP
jgi:high-affinity Fe2+/Pb2+ permease